MTGQSERDLVAGVIQLANLLTRRLAPVFEKARVTPQQWAILSVLAASSSPMSLASLARAMMVSKQNMTGMMARLEQLGFAERVAPLLVGGTKLFDGSASAAGENDS